MSEENEEHVCESCMNVSLQARVEQSKVLDQLTKYSELLTALRGSDTVTLSVMDSMAWHSLGEATIPLGPELGQILSAIITNQIVRLTTHLTAIKNVQEDLSHGDSDDSAPTP